MVAWRARLRHYRRLAPVLIMRTAPLPWRWKRWMVWAISPRYGIGVYAIIQDEAGAVLSLLSAYSERWQLPGGGVKYGESLEQAMHREAREELGLELKNLRLTLLLDDTSGRGLHAVYRAALGAGVIRLSEEHTQWRYLSTGGLSPFYRRCVVRALASPEPFVMTDRVGYAE
jgi:nucleoside triphosphatase